MVQKFVSALFKERVRRLHLFTGILLFLVVGGGLFLVTQYYYFRRVTMELLELKEEYRVYTLAVKKLLDQKAAENGTEEKKKIGSLSDENQEADERPFLTVNRDSEYLLANAVRFARKYELETSVAQMFEAQEWKQGGRARKPVSRKKMRRRRQRRATVQPKRPIVTAQEAGLVGDFHFSWPIDRSQFWLSSLFGPRKIKHRGWKFHYGIDMAAVRGTAVYAAATGIVLESHFHKGYGNCIIVAHNKKYKTRYAHLDKRKVKVGQKVERGQVIGTVGATGAVFSKYGRDASHLHFEVYVFERHVNPLTVLA